MNGQEGSGKATIELGSSAYSQCGQESTDGHRSMAVRSSQGTRTFT